MPPKAFNAAEYENPAVTPLSFQTAERIAKELKGRRIIKIINNPKDSWDEQDSNKVKNY